SIYHSMQTKVTKRFSDSLISVAYTVSKGIGDSEAVVGWLEQSGTPGGFQDNYNRRLDRALNAFDNPQRLVVAYTAELPFGKGKKWMANARGVGWGVSGWEFNGFYTAESGTPLFLGPRPISRTPLEEDRGPTTTEKPRFCPEMRTNASRNGSTPAYSASRRRSRSETPAGPCRTCAITARTTSMSDLSRIIGSTERAG